MSSPNCKSSTHELANTLKKKSLASPIAWLLFFICYGASGSTIEIQFDAMIDSSDEVALVEILDGKTIAYNGSKCGSAYKARVLRSYKGKSTMTLHFGSLDGLQIGKTYFVSLYSKKIYILNRTGLLKFQFATYPNKMKDKVMNEWALCQKHIPDKMVGGAELGAMPAERPAELGYSMDAVKVPSISIRLPDQTECTQATSVSEYDKGLEAVWVTLPEMERITVAAVKHRPIPDDHSHNVNFLDCVSPNADVLHEISAASVLWKHAMDGTYLFNVCDIKCKNTPPSKQTVGTLVIDSSRQMLSNESEAMKFLVRGDIGTLEADYCYYFPEDGPGQHGTALQMDIVGFGNIDWLPDGATLTFLNDSPDFRFISKVALKGQNLVGDWAQNYAGDGGVYTPFPKAQLSAKRVGPADPRICIEQLRKHERSDLKSYCIEFKATTCELGDRKP